MTPSSADLFQRVGDVMVAIWDRFLREFGDIMLSAASAMTWASRFPPCFRRRDIRTIIPQYKRVIDLVHAHDKPFLFHSCGNIFSVMDDRFKWPGSMPSTPMKT